MQISLGRKMCASANGSVKVEKLTFCYNFAMPLPPDLINPDLISLASHEAVEKARRLMSSWAIAARGQTDPIVARGLLDVFDDLSEQINIVLLTITDPDERAEAEKLQSSFQNIGTVSRRNLEKLFQPKEPQKMTQLELIAELRQLGVDPILTYGKEASDDRSRLLARFFVKNAGSYQSLKHEDGSDASPREKIEVLVEQVHFLLGLLNGKLEQGKGYATRPRQDLTKLLNQYLLTRDQILIACTYHPDWGKDVRMILDEAIKDGAAATTKYLDPSNPDKRVEVVVSGPSMRPQKFNYGLLTSSEGSAYLSAYIDQCFPAVPTKAKELAKMIFEVFTLSDIILAQGQREANGTRGHNTDEKYDPIFTQDPVASFVQNWDRYGANLADWRAWFLVFLEDIPDGLYGAAGNAHDMREFQKLIRFYYDMFFPIEVISRQPVAGYCESYFPDARDMVMLNPLVKGEESIDLLGLKTVKGKDGVTTADVAPQLFDWDKYDIAVDGWKTMIEFSFKSLGTNLTEHQILETYGEEKKGMLNDFFSAASKAKMFAPKHLALFLEPMMTLFCARLIQSSSGDMISRKELRDKMIEQIRKTGQDERALKDYQRELDAVITHLEDDEVCTLGPVSRHNERHQYIHKLYDHHGWPKGHANIPHLFGRRDPKAEEFKALIQFKKFPSPPAQRTGSMVDEKQAKTH